MITLQSIDLSQTDNDTADWMELYAYLHSKAKYMLLENAYTDNQDINEDDFSLEDAELENFKGKIESILYQRQEGINESYPFNLEEDGLSIKEKITSEQYIYIFCLIISHLRSGGLLANETDLLSNDIRDLFQVAATAAAAGELSPEGRAYCLGWPRPKDDTDFLTALRTVYKRIGSGTVISCLPAHTRYVKDGGIDIIGWAHYNTGGMRSYLLGQVASGADWFQKPVEANYFHETFFEKRPIHSEDCIRATFTPEIIGKNYSEEQWNDYIRSVEATHGKIICRKRLVLLAARGLKSAMDSNEPPSNVIHRHCDLIHIEKWVEELRC